MVFEHHKGFKIFLFLWLWDKIFCKCFVNMGQVKQLMTKSVKFICFNKLESQNFTTVFFKIILKNNALVFLTLHKQSNDYNIVLTTWPGLTQVWRYVHCCLTGQRILWKKRSKNLKHMIMKSQISTQKCHRTAYCRIRYLPKAKSMQKFKSEVVHKVKCTQKSKYHIPSTI